MSLECQCNEAIGVEGPRLHKMEFLAGNPGRRRPGPAATGGQRPPKAPLRLPKAPLRLLT
jgi:hypothetical protein